MPKLSPKLMKEAIEEFKSKFTGGFYHGSPSNKIKAFDSTKNTDPMKLETPGVTFVTRDPDFAEAFLPMTERGQYKTGATMYPVKVNLGKHWHPDTPEGQEVIKSYLTKMYPHEANPDDLIDLQKEMSMGRWTDIENPHFLQHLRDTGHDTFFVEEGGIPNVGVFEPHNIRGKFAEYNPEEAMNPDFMKAEGGAVQHFDKGSAVRSGLTELMQLIRQRGGDAAAKRLEKAADLVPNLEHQFTPEALKSAFTGDNATAVMVMRPGDFEKYAAPIPAEIKSSAAKTYGIANPETLKDYKDMPRGTYQDYLNYLSQYSAPGGGGFSSVPYLQLNKEPNRIFPNIAGHEGRHRTATLELQNAPSTLVQMMPRSNLREALPRRSQEEYLDALIQEIGNRPAVKPQTYFDNLQQKDISRGLIDLPEMFASGGNVLKKTLEFARKVPFVHFSHAENISQLQPSMYGTGIKGAEAARLKEAPDIRPRSYVYVGENIKPEQGLGPHKYTGMMENSYPLHEDPADFYSIAKQQAVDPFFAKQGIEVVDRNALTNALERQIKEAGYGGYHTDTAGVLFHPTDVIKSTD